MTSRFITILLTVFSLMGVKASTPDSLTVIYTTDVHGCFFPYDFIKGEPASGSLARVAELVGRERAHKGADRVMVLDAGDFLQGQPSAYYYNFVDTTRQHLASRIFNFIGYDAVTIGNHDIETGHAVYDRVARELNMPVLGANVLLVSNGSEYFAPYLIKIVGTRKVAVIGLITPAIPAWLPERLWSGLKFADMIPVARYWVEKVIREEKPDAVIGLFHSGHDSAQTTAGYLENMSLEIARQVPGFDAVLMGHDHREYSDIVTGPDGRVVCVLNPANNAKAVGMLNLMWEEGSQSPTISGKIESLEGVDPSPEFMAAFADDMGRIEDFVNQPITKIADDMRSAESLSGPSAMMTLIHELQIDVTGAQISLAAPLSLNADISKGQLTVADMFKLYKYENNLCTMRLTGREVLKHLEESYRQWLDPDGRYPIYNFDSAYGIDYIVNPQAVVGERVKILSLSDGSPFEPEAVYTVAVNSYRAGGGGNHLTLGAGIEPSELKGRIVATTPKDIRYYLIEYLKGSEVYIPHVVTNWHFTTEVATAP